MSSDGNFTSFGDITSGGTDGALAAASKVKGIAAGGQTASGWSYSNAISQFNFASNGDTTDFGDLTNSPASGAGVSNNDGGQS